MAADCPIKVGVLHSLSGTMAISETTLKDTMLMLIDQQNAKGGVLGCQLEAVVVDPASDWPLFAEKAREMHYGESENAPIHGRATRDEAEDMVAEGIAVAPLLVPVAPPDELN